MRSTAGCRSLALAAAVCAAALPASARIVELPLRLDYPFLRQLAVEELFSGPDETARPWRDASGCNAITLSKPDLFERDQKLRLRARFEARVGAGIGGACFGTARRSGLVDAALEPRLHPSLPIVEFRVADSELLEADGTKRLAGRLWDGVRLQVHPQLETLRVDLQRPVAELKTFLPHLFSAARSAAWQERFDALALADPEVRPDALALVARFELPELAPESPESAAPPATQPVEPPLAAEEIARWQEAWRSWDAFLTWLIRYGLRDADEPLRRELRNVLLEARESLEAVLLAESKLESGKVPADPVPALFLETWSELAPLLRRLAAHRPGESALRYLSLIAAADAFEVLQQLGPGYGVELSTGGLRRMARMLEPAPSVDPTAYSEALDPELRELFGFGPPLPVPPPDSDGAAREPGADAR